MSSDINSKESQIWEKFRNKSYRDAFVTSHLSTNIAAQIYSMREARGWTQRQLAEATGMAQARISVMEDPSYDKLTLSTLKRLASAFDVALVVRFVRFSDLLRWAVGMTPEALAVPNFEDDRLAEPESQPADVLRRAMEPTSLNVAENRIRPFLAEAFAASANRRDASIRGPLSQQGWQGRTVPPWLAGETLTQGKNVMDKTLWN